MNAAIARWTGMLRAAAGPVIARGLALAGAWRRLPATGRILAALAAADLVLLATGAITLLGALAGLAAVGAAGWLADPAPGGGLQPQPQPAVAVAAPGAITRPAAAGDGAAEPGWRSVVDALATPALVVSAGGTIEHANAAARTLFPLGRPGQPIAHANRSPELLEAVDRVAATRDDATVEIEERVPVERRFLASIAPLAPARAAPGQPDLVVVLHDLTEQTRLARMRADFVAYASHELRTPLSSLKGFVETLQGAARDDPVARERFLGIMAAQADRMTRLIDDLLSLSRVEMNQHLAPRTTVDLNEIAGFVAQSLEPVARAAGVTLRLETAPAPALVQGDREELVQMLLNLAQNAVKYGRKGGQAVIRVAGEALPAPGYALAVADDGEGIAPEHLPRLTERFYRVDAAVSREKGGTGLGLAIVKHIVNRHRGELAIQSAAGRGSTFTVRLPAVEK